MDNNTVERIYKGLEKYNLYPEEVYTYFDGDTSSQRIVVSIHKGDWKHEHLRCDMLMQKMGYIPDGSLVTEEDGSDCYSADRYYRKGQVLK